MGIFEKIEDACVASAAAQKELMAKCSTKDRQKMIENIKKRALERLEEICMMKYTETGYGRYEDKVLKNGGSFSDTPDTRDVPVQVYSGSKGLTIDYFAPFGVVGAITPVTNPASTIIANTICNLAVGNSLVFNPHPAGVKSASWTIDLVNRAIVEAGGPENMCTAAAKPTMETLDYILKHPDIHLILGTGGPAMVRTLFMSGKKCICAGPGNPPSIIDSTADIKRAAYEVTQSSTFDNNILCVAEKEIFVVADVYDEFIKEFEAVGNVHLTAEQADVLRDMCLIKNPEGSPEPYSANKKYVGKNANVILEAAGIHVEGDPRLAFFEADNMDPFVQTEQMMPIMPVVKCDTFEQAMERAHYAEHGNRHSASIWTKDLYHTTAFGKIIETTVFVMNGRTFAAFGLGGEGSNTPTIATPTGEGPTGPQSFARRRRFAMADGQGFVI
ncbi:MAG: aldehyde dehydrogenase [Oscillospiraceae bacterium]|nr:aldehyde dehydrogenase [Oscillospiraceae bacterium]